MTNRSNRLFSLAVSFLSFEAVHTMLKDLGENKVEVLAKAWQASSFRSSKADLAGLHVVQQPDRGSRAESRTAGPLRSSKQRLLLADEVGLGKTIEAGFILCEMLARHPHTFRRVLIVCKASLCFKWQMEMRKRFDLRFDIWRAGELREFHRRYREDEDLELRAICSLESYQARRERQGVAQEYSGPI
jgi:SNF2 family DNA or RNA helicase